MLAAPAFMEAEFATSEMPALLLVPEMRLGNRALVEPEDPRAYIEVDRDLINEENDRALLKKSREALQQIRRENPKCRILFWSLFGREYENRVLGRYQHRFGRYRHPVWNLKDLESEFRGQTIPLKPLLKDSRTAALFVDRSMHPSWLGQQLIMRLIDDPETRPEKHFDALWQSVKKPVIDFDKPTVLTGRSLWLRRLQQHIDTGLLALGPHTQLMDPQEVDQADPQADVAFIAGLSQRTHPFVDRARTLARVLKKYDNASPERSVRLFLWEARAAEAKQPRVAEDLFSARALSQLLTPYGLLDFQIRENTQGQQNTVQWRDVELARDNAPSITGLLSVAQSVGARISEAPMER